MENLNQHSKNVQFKKKKCCNNLDTFKKSTYNIINPTYTNKYDNRYNK